MGMSNKGRKNFGEEMQIKKRYSDLSEKVFDFYMECFESGDKADKKWASEQIGKGLVKMIPQDVTSGGKPININFDGSFKTTQQTEGDSSEQS